MGFIMVLLTGEKFNFLVFPYNEKMVVLFEEELFSIEMLERFLACKRRFLVLTRREHPACSAQILIKLWG